MYGIRNYLFSWGRDRNSLERTCQIYTCYDSKERAVDSIVENRFQLLKRLVEKMCKRYSEINDQATNPALKNSSD